MFLIGDLEDGVTFDIIYHVDRWLGRYPESLMKIRHDLAQKKLFSGGGLGWGGGWGGFFSKFKDRFKPINI